MSDKREKILKAALELFSVNGFSATSTSRIAKQAGVSEGLIFRHYGNKDGLLQAILEKGEEQAKIIFSDIVFEADPKEVIRKTLRLGDKMLATKESADFWKLQYKIKWEIEHYSDQKMEPLEHALSRAFKKLEYKNPEAEAEVLLSGLDGIATRFFLQKDVNIKAMVNDLFEKYNL